MGILGAATKECNCKLIRLQRGTIVTANTVVRNHRVRTIEGDLFTAFVAARAISKANGDDPKKSSLIRCARTDKGVHAAANLISLKLIIEDPDIVQKINEKLSPQIRVFNIQRTNGAFSAYQSCDSRIYEYLIPTHAFLPPHPKSFLGKKLEELAEEADDIEGYRSRQCEVSTFWEETEERYIKPILEQLDHSIRSQVIEALYKSESGTLETDIKSKNPDEIEQTNDTSSNLEIKCRVDLDGSRADKPTQQATIFETEDADQQNVGKNIGDVKNLDITNTIQHTQEGIVQSENSTEDPQSTTEKASALDQAIKSLRAAYIHAKNAYRIDAARLARVRSVLSLFVGSHNYHNYTIQKRFQDPSAKRVIKSFVVHNDAPLVAPGGGEEWLSLKVHGQSFMMHQIRKMVGMAALVVRCGCPETRLQDSYLGSRISIPKAPGLGLLLERPVFDVYNKNQARQPQQHQQQQVERVNIDFGRFDDVITEFKQREIYDRIFREEERDHQFVSPPPPFPPRSKQQRLSFPPQSRFHAFFASIDNLASSRLLHLSSVGISATTRAVPSDTGLELGIGREVGALIDGSEEDEVEGGDGDGG